MVGLFVGSEGTLGVVTEVTLRLRPALAGTPRTVVGAFGDLVAAGEAVAQITRRGLAPSVLELLDRACLTAVENWKHLGLEADAAALLLARVDTQGDSGAAESDGLAAAMTGAGALWVAQSTDDEEAEALFEARRLAYPAFERLGPVLTEDVCVPRSRVPAMLAQIEAIAARHGVQISTIAHAGDGNLHPLIVTPRGRRRRAGRGPGRVRGASRRGDRAGRHGDRRARGRAAETGRDAPRARPGLACPAAGGAPGPRPARGVQPGQRLITGEDPLLLGSPPAAGGAGRLPGRPRVASAAAPATAVS